MSNQQALNCNLIDETVIVTHVNSPTLFYCRIEQDIERYEQLKQLIRQHIDSEPHSMPDLTKRNSGSIISALVYSDIHNDWCRARLISMKLDHNHKPICAKVRLIDFGSIEFVSWKPEF
ncbi:Tudor domain-containing protein, partial [Euroglyphus maynei]